MKLIRVQRILLFAVGVLVLRPAAAQTSPYAPKEIEPPANKAAKVQITEGPSLELYRNNEAIVRWTSDNPGGSDEHWGVVHYGTDPSQLAQTAKGHIRLNQEHSYAVFRVRLPDIKPGKTYYYSVASTSADGTLDNVKSGVYQFTAPAGGYDNSAQKSR
jgi:hypothetical protein